MVSTPTRPKKARSQKKTAKKTASKSVVRARHNIDIVWEKLPDDFVLPDDPVDNTNQPDLAGALSESLSLAGYLSPNAFTSTNYGICAKLDGKTVVKAPDWAWMPAIKVSKESVERSYTPHLDGDPPIVVMEFLSYTPGGEYSVKSSYPPGKRFYYEQILQVPVYVIFEPKSGTIEVFLLGEDGAYGYYPCEPNEEGLFWLEAVGLFLGVWEGTRLERTGYWLRWWNPEGQLLLWGEELTEQERQKAEQERQKAEQERQKAEQIQRKAVSKLSELGLSVEQIAETLDISVEEAARFSKS